MEGKLSTSALQLRLLGPPQVKQNNRGLVIQRRKVQALLFYLAVNGEVHQRATLAALLWPESDQQQAHGSLRRHLSALNRLLGDGWIETEGDAVRLSGRDDLWVDIDEFQNWLAACQEHDHPADTACARCIEPLTAAVALYRADFLAGFTLPDAPAFDEWQLFQTEELRFAYATALDRLVEAHFAQDRVAEAIPYARRRLSLDPLHEPTHRQLMRLYATTDQQMAALRQYEFCAQTLKAELDVPPSPETNKLYEQVRRGELAVSVKTQPIEVEANRVLRHNLPASTTPFIGRSVELAELIGLCRDPTRRLITILGPGGVGKTRLSLEVAAQLVAETSHGVFLVRLTQLSDPTNMVPAIADALNFQFQADGRPSQEQLFAYLEQKQHLLVLDNFEHLLEGVTFVQDLLQRCPQLRLLVTSRERLKLTGETVFALGNLNFPTWETPQHLQGYEAVQLFMETAHRIRPTEALQEDDMQYVVRICRIVGGMPLGIILAAAWVEHLSPATIAAELTQGFDLLETELRDLPERQRSMRAILAYSWQRLAAEEQAVFMRLAVFRGGFNRAAAGEVAGASLPILARLVDKSFVQPVAGERYDVHELLRQYARQQLEAAGAYSGAQEAHGAYYLNFLQQCEPHLAGAEQLETIHQIEADFENIRAAWRWAVETHHYGLVDQALDGLFRWFWLRRSRQREGLALLGLAYQQWMPTSGQTPQPVWGRISARMLEQQGPWLGDPAAVRDRVEQALAIAQQHQNQAEMAFCRWALGLVIVSERHDALHKVEMQPAVNVYQQAILEYRSQDDQFWLAQTLEHLGHCYRGMRHLALAVPVLQESLDLRRTLGDRFGMARSFRELGFVTLFQGLDQETENAWQAAYILQSDLGDQQGIADSRFFLAVLALCRGDWQLASKLANEVMKLAIEMNNALYQQWTSRALEIAACMEQDAQRLNSISCSFPNDVTPFSGGLAALLFSFNLEVRRANLQTCLVLATTDLEIAVSLPFAADLSAQAGDHHRSVRLLALAFRYPEVANGWVGHLPEIVALQQELRERLPPDEFEQVWAQGQGLDLQATITELLNTDD